jgi:hypothetical protein
LTVVVQVEGWALEDTEVGATGEEVLVAADLGGRVGAVVTGEEVLVAAELGGRVGAVATGEEALVAAELGGRVGTVAADAVVGLTGS